MHTLTQVSATTHYCVMRVFPWSVKFALYVNYQLQEVLQEETVEMVLMVEMEEMAEMVQMEKTEKAVLQLRQI